MTRVSVNQGHPTFLLQRSASVIVGCWFAGRMWKNKKWCASPAGLCPWVGDPCHKRNCTLNRSLDTLQQSCSFCCSCCLLTVSVICTDKQDLLSLKFHLNDFCQIFVADSFGFVLLFTFYCGFVES